MSDDPARFYVYEAISDNGECLYIGKGTGRRLEDQKRRFKCEVRVIKWFKSEASAFKFEAFQITDRSPIFNKKPGGSGGRVKTTALRKPKLTEIENGIQELGSRVYVARALLGFDLSRQIDASKIETIRQVAYGSGC
jgi:hypothetical protein